MSEVLEIISPGGGLTLQDLGRPGWKRFGVPASGAMDADSARQANRLVGNPDEAPVLEMLFTGARLRVLASTELALTGAAVRASHPYWKSFPVEPREEISFAECAAGVWSYLAVRGGFAAPRWFGSASTNPRAGPGSPLCAGDRLAARPSVAAAFIAGRFLPVKARPHFAACPTFDLFSGPEWDSLPFSAQRQLAAQVWTISRQSDRTGYRLEGTSLDHRATAMLSAPVALGTLQLPPGGQPIVILRDGPTVGGYPRIAILPPDQVSRFTQCAPGTPVKFRLLP